ncbi:hypothetical protein [uncultured Duncaniella sp.]|uniref:virion core protein, T7 gp14 family n=1 Tax=uncultured Duncaniella sp. TaxID=2768039 RepID=UPI0025B70FD4|nr:hypothetical protein [uncultured Duncaniella sp.]
MIGSLIGAGLSAVGSIFGGISASKAMKKVKNNLESQKRENQDWYDRRYNEDATQRADAQRILSKTEESIRNRNRQAAGSAAVMGGTEESVAAAKAANNAALADATATIAANADARKDQIEAQYQQKKAQVDDALNNLEMNKAQAISSAVQGVAQAGAGIAGAF